MINFSYTFFQNTPGTSTCLSLLFMVACLLWGGNGVEMIPFFANVGGVLPTKSQKSLFGLPSLCRWGTLVFNQIEKPIAFFTLMISSFVTVWVGRTANRRGEKWQSVWIPDLYMPDGMLLHFDAFVLCCPCDRLGSFCPFYIWVNWGQEI